MLKFSLVTIVEGEGISKVYNIIFRILKVNAKFIG